MSSILYRLNEHYAKLALEDSKRPWIPRPSALGGCLREAAFRLSGMEPYPNSPESMRTFELGHQRGAALEEIAKAWPFAQTQVEVSIPMGWQHHDFGWEPSEGRDSPKEEYMKGTIDLWLPTERTIVDFKTSGVFGFSMDYDGGYDLQLQAYRHGMLHFFTGDNQPKVLLEQIRCVLVYECKDSDARKGVRAGALKEVEVPHTEELEERYQQKLKDIRTMLLLKARGALDPTLVAGMPRENGKEHWKCRMKDGMPMYCSIGTVRGKCNGA